jgi:dTDP-4-amino-4,6-dideoxygalactose transaminase
VVSETASTQAVGPWKIPLSDVLVEDDLLEAARETLGSGWWSMGPRVAAFEEEFAALSDSEHALAVANGTAALHIALLAVGCGPGDEVVLPSLNFVAAANTVVHTGATPVFCDVRGERDLNLDAADLESALTERTRAVIVLHYGGYPCEIEPVLEACRSRGIAIVEDAAHAVGATRGGRACGSFGDVGCFSFFSNKNLPVGEGGMLVTSDDAVAERMRLLRSHGMTTLTWDRHRGHAAGYDVLQPGFNYRLDELRAALGSVQLRHLLERNAARGEHARRYREALDGREGVVVPFADDDAAAHHLAVAVLPEGASRDRVRARLAAARIQTSVHYPPIHRFSAFAANRSRPLPRTDALGERILTLPLYAHMEPEQVDTVADALLEALKESSSAAE